MATTEQKNCDKVELVVWHFIRNHFENKYNQQIPMTLKYLTKYFSNRITMCRMLTFQEDIEFFELVVSELGVPACKHVQFKLLYRTSEHNDISTSFHNICNGHGPTITIIKSKFGNIFGGFTQIKWTSGESNWHKDRKAFLFLIRSNDELIQTQCPKAYHYCDWGDFHVFHAAKCGPTFGGGWDHGDSFDIELGNRWKHDDTHCWTYNGSYNHKNELCGADKFFDYTGKKYRHFELEDYEVFELHNLQLTD
eukprot:126886_1